MFAFSEVQVPSSQAKHRIVTTPYPTINIEGVECSFKKYLGIPYAKPPVGNLRWKKPVSYGNLSATTNEAVAYKSTCQQIFLPDNAKVGEEDEDCLYLNIWVPDKTPAPDKARAVIVFIYGGAFISSSADTYNGEKLVNYVNVESKSRVAGNP
ncbi:acetylcholinesterase-like [Mya arenaria]|uniref:acetylcholinesterase-like n=1 Tax=Mya arenaria TaxID=6604 RepID=UPI0022E6CEB7|nr:acetylcholinesterase-like [Mya arenaria]